MRVIQTPKEKLKRAAGKKSIQIAKDGNDPLYKMYQKHRRLYLIAKLRIIRKNLPKAMSIVRQHKSK